MNYTVLSNEDEFAWAMGQLDDYEGVNVESDEMHFIAGNIAEVRIDKWANAPMPGYTGIMEM